MENAIEITSVPIIIAIVYAAMELYKGICGDKTNLMKFIPVIAAALGMVLGIIAFYAAPMIIAADNVLTAILIGGASGLAATGANQIVKQLTKKKTAVEPDAATDPDITEDSESTGEPEVTEEPDSTEENDVPKDDEADIANDEKTDVKK